MTVLIHNRRTVVRECGFTMIELVVGLLIGMLVMGVASTLFESSARSRNSVVNMTELQEESFFISHTLRQQLAQVRFRALDHTKLDERLIPVTSLAKVYPKVDGLWEPEQGIKINGTTLGYRFSGSSNSAGAADGSIYDCLGNPVGFGTITEVTLSLVDSKLVCEVGTTSLTILGDSNGVSVEQIDYQLGVDDNADGAADRIIDSDTATPSDFINARHITIRLLLATPDRAVTYHQKYRYNGTETIATDHRLRVESVTSVALRN